MHCSYISLSDFIFIGVIFGEVSGEIFGEAYGVVFVLDVLSPLFQFSITVLFSSIESELSCTLLHQSQAILFIKYNIITYN